MKYIIVLTDGMADEALADYQNRTPLDMAKIPTIDDLAQRGQVGLVQTVPQGMAPGSDTANLSVLGYDPKSCYTGRSPLEAASVGVPLKAQDMTLRMNFVTLSEDKAFEDRVMLDHSAGELTTPEADHLLEVVRPLFESRGLDLYKGTSYRHIVHIKNRQDVVGFIPPHDIINQGLSLYLGQGMRVLEDIMREAVGLLASHPINQKRKDQGLNPANGIWMWGEGSKPSLDAFKDLYGLDGAVISAVDLIKGIGILSGMQVIEVPGADGSLHTNYEGKVAHGLEALNGGKDFLFLHIEAPDECGHRGDVEGKIQAIEYIDDRVVKPLVKALEGQDFRLLILPDHATPIIKRTHTSDPVPFVMYDSRNQGHQTNQAYTEKSGKASGVIYETGRALLRDFLEQV